MPLPIAEPTLRAARAHPIPSLIEASIDPNRVRHYVDEFAARYPAQMAALATDPERLHWLTTAFAFSHFLSEELLRHPDWIFQINDLDQPLSPNEYQRRLSLIDPSALDLALFRRKELLRIVLRDVLRYATLSEITQELSNLADSIVARALEAVTAQFEQRYGAPQTENGPATFTVLALGKLGGRELNYSSDIDLMFLYSANGETAGPHPLTNREFFKKISNQLTNLLSTYTAAGLCYRVDLRLRPEGSLGEACISLAAAKDYYATRRRDWELQMLIKGRAAAGDAALGQELLDFVEPSIYSTTTDFSLIETMSETRERIGEKLARKRLRKEDRDVKLAPGGIRDIEFLVQCLQRLHGARESAVRHGGTLLALSRLHEKDLLSTTEYSRLSGAYHFLRHLEHRLQFEDDRQTHALPSAAIELERIARRMLPAAEQQRPNIGVSTQLLQDLNQHLENVQAIYERIVHAQRPLYYTPASSSTPAADSAPKTLSESSPVPVPESLLAAIDPMAPTFVQRLRERGIYRSERALAGFLERLLQRPSCLELLETNATLADCMIQIFELSPFLSEQLASAPELLEDIRRLADHPTHRWAFEGLAAPLNDTDGLRRFFRREMFRIEAGSVCLPESVFQTLDRTSALAEFVIARAYRIALERGLAHARSHATSSKPFEEPQAEMMVIALGRLGMREFDLASDADLLFIIPDHEGQRQRFWTRVAEHLIEILTAYTGEGTILSLDTRLRPNGREGMLVQTESKYVDYFGNRAEAWEGIAYMKARGVAGDTDRALAFLTELQRVDWRRYGQSGRSKQDLRQMRMRLQREQGAATPLKAGLGGYYDADFILMYLRLKGAGMFFKSLNTPERIDILEKMGHLDANDAQFLLRATTFFRALDHAVRLVSGRAEERLPQSISEREMVAELMHRWTSERPSAATLESELQSLQTRTRALFDRFFAQ